MTILLFASLLLVLALGLPVAFCFGGIAIIFVLWQWGPKALYMLATTTFGEWTNYILIAIPLFILMAHFLERSGIADDLYEAMYRWLGPLHGGLAMGTVVICTIFAAMSGISGVATVTMGLIALPSMLKRRYDKSIAVGCISAGGTLGILIPPSVLMIVYAHLTGESVGALFMGGVFPGLIISALFIGYIGIKCALHPHLGPPVPKEERTFNMRQKLASLKAIVFPAFLIVLVLGLIYAGVTTATEAAGVGAFGALVGVLIHRRFSLKMLNDSLMGTLRITCMVMWILIGAKAFTHVYTAIGAPEFVHGLVSGWQLNRWLILIAMQGVLFILGMFMDPAGIIMICTPVFVPVIKSLGFNPVWFGILFTINMEMGYITPPFGFNLFYMRSLVPKEITMMDVYKSIVPFVFLEMIGLALVMIFPQIALWLPSTMIKR